MSLYWCLLCTWEQPCFLKPAVDLPVTLLSTGVRQHSDMTVVPPCLIHVYICLIWSVHQSGPSGLIRVLISPQIFSRILACPGGFQRAYRLQLVNKKLWYVSLFSLFAPQLFSRMFLASQHISHLFYSSVRECHWGYLDQVGCVMHLLSPLVPWRRRAGGPWAEWCMFIGCHHFQLNSQALRSSRDDLWAIRWQCPSVLCPFALWSFSFCLSAPFLPPLSPRSFILCSPVSFHFCFLVFLL